MPLGAGGILLKTHNVPYIYCQLPSIGSSDLCCSQCVSCYSKYVTSVKHRLLPLVDMQSYYECVKL